MLDLSKNTFKAALATRTQQVGLWSSLCSPLVAEMEANAGFDWLLFDSEHSPIELADMAGILQAAAAGPSHCAVRVAWNDLVLIKKALDIGAQTIFVPFVQTVEEAKAAVRAAKYPPAGIRGVAGSTRASGYGRIPDYIARANDEICVIIQVETIESTKHIPEMGKIDGLDGIFVGPADLAASMGYPGQPTHPEVLAKLKELVGVINAAGKPAGVLTTRADLARQFLDWGFTFVAAGVDNSLLFNAIEQLRKDVPNP